MYDIIGDVHGFADELKTLLHQLSYREQNGSWKHPERKAIFLGDLIDRGPKVRETLHIVRKMVDNGNALVVMGNHEYNAICYHTRHRITGEYLRRHTENNIKQHSASLNAFLNKDAEFAGFIQWFRHIPLFLELDGLRVCHATWISTHIDHLKSLKSKPLLDDDFLEKSVFRTNYEFSVVNELLKGIEINLPREFQFNVDGIVRDKMRVKWWKGNYRTFKDLAIGVKSELPDGLCPSYFTSALPTYNLSEPPIFIGHYGLHGSPKLLEPNICCLDYNISKGGRLAAYRWDGEKELSETKFVSVEYGEQLWK